MPNYHDLRPSSDFEERGYPLVFPKMTKTEKKRCINGLLRLREGLQQVATKKADKNLLIGSWNIKEFGHTTQRLNEAYFYIAEIVAAFDLIAIQEIKSTLVDLDILMRLLGDNWDYVVNDVTNGRDGNAERGGYIFNRNRVRLAGLAGEITLWDELTEHYTIKQLKRAPYITGFQAGWKSFAMINLHLHPGDKPEDLAHRQEEVALLLAAFKEKKRRGHFWTKNLILVGDFNFYAADSETIGSIEDGGFFQIDSLADQETNASLTEAYDRFFLTHNDYFSLEPGVDGRSLAGVFNPFEYVYRDGDMSPYKATMLRQYTGSKDLANDANALGKYYKNPWRKNQMSDHFPIWFSIDIDSSSDFLKSKLGML